MLSPLRSPVLWILVASVLVVIGITLLFELQDADTDWRRTRWDGSVPAPAEERAAAEPPAPGRSEAGW
jgi:hypothetical protein